MRRHILLTAHAMLWMLAGAAAVDARVTGTTWPLAAAIVAAGLVSIVLARRCR